MGTFRSFCSANLYAALRRASGAERLLPFRNWNISACHHISRSRALPKRSPYSQTDRLAESGPHVACNRCADLQAFSGCRERGGSALFQARPPSLISSVDVFPQDWQFVNLKSRLRVAGKPSTWIVNTAAFIPNLAVMERGRGRPAQFKNSSLANQKSNALIKKTDKVHIWWIITLDFPARIRLA